MRALLVVALTASVAGADPRAHKIEAAYMHVKEFRADFTQTIVNATSGTKTVTKGVASTSRPDKIRFTFYDKTNKVRSEVVFDGKMGWAIDHLSKKIDQIAIRETDLRLVVAFLRSKTSVFEKTHEIIVTGNKLAMTPKGKGAARYKLVLEFVPATSLVRSSTLSTPNGDVATYAFSATNLEVKHPPGTFAFDPKAHPDYTVTMHATAATTQPREP